MFGYLLVFFGGWAVYWESKVWDGLTRAERQVEAGENAEEASKHYALPRLSARHRPRYKAVEAEMTEKGLKEEN